MTAELMKYGSGSFHAVDEQTCVCSITLWGLSLSAQIKVIFKYLYFYTADTFDQQLYSIWLRNLLSN